MRTYIAVFCLIWLGYFASPAHANWTEAASDNFTLQGQVSPAQASEMVRELEIFRSVLLQAIGAAPAQAPTPTQIFAIKPTPSFTDLLPYPGFSVLSQSDLDGPVYLMNTDAAWSDASPERHKILRDYALHIVTTYAPKQYPHWMQSGLADHYAAHSFADGKFTSGLPIESYAYPLARGKWVPMDSVVGSQHAFAPVKMRGNMDGQLALQAQSWAAVQYLMAQPNHTTAQNTYLGHLSDGQRPVKAFKKAYRVSPRKLGKRVRGFLKFHQGSFPGKVSHAEPQNVDIKTRSMTSIDGAVAYAKVLKIFAYTEAGQSAAKQHIERAALSRSLDALLLKANLASDAGDFDAAQATLKQAFSSKPGSAQAHKAAGGLFLSEYDKSEDIQMLASARDHYEAALRDWPKDPAVNYYYAAICAKIECQSRVAGNAARNALSYYRDAQYIGMNLNILSVLQESNQAEDIYTYSKFASAWAPDRQAFEIAKLWMSKSEKELTQRP